MYLIELNCIYSVVAHTACSAVRYMLLIELRYRVGRFSSHLEVPKFKART
jgi:hypothetical protein